MFWSPKMIKELKERGYKFRVMTLEEANAEVEDQAARFKLQAASIKLLDILPLIKFYLVKGEGLN